MVFDRALENKIMFRVGGYGIMVRVGGIRVRVGGIRVRVGGIRVRVGGIRVRVGGKRVRVSGTCIRVRVCLKVYIVYYVCVGYMYILLHLWPMSSWTCPYAPLCLYLPRACTNPVTYVCVVCRCGRYLCVCSWAECMFFCKQTMLF